MDQRGNSFLHVIVVIAITLAILLFLHINAPMIAVFGDLAQVGIVLVRTFIIFIFSFMMLRLLGKRQLSQLTFIDLLIIIALGSAVGDVMIYSESIAQLINSVIAVGFITLMVLTINSFIAKYPDFGRFVEGRSTLVVKHGKIQRKALIAESMNEDELREELRSKGFYRISDLEEVVLESTGKFSIKRKKRKRVTV